MLRFIGFKGFVVFILCCFFSVAMGKDGNYFYGEGSGSSKQEAKAQALKDLATNLQVSVQYSATDTTSHTNNTLTSSGSSNISLQSQIKDLPGIEVYEEKKKGSTFHAKVRVNKAQLQNALYGKVSTSQARLVAMAGSCFSVPFKSYNAFKRTLKDYKRDLTLYQIVSKNMNYGTAELVRYEKMAGILPRYKLEAAWSGFSDNDEVIGRIVSSELDKFITRDSNADSTLYVKIFNDTGLLALHLQFSDCEGNPDSVIDIKTDLRTSSLHEEKNQRRIGPVIYKQIENYLENN